MSYSFLCWGVWIVTAKTMKLRTAVCEVPVVQHEALPFGVRRISIFNLFFRNNIYIFHVFHRCRYERTYWYDMISRHRFPSSYRIGGSFSCHGYASYEYEYVRRVVWDATVIQG